jgi:O-antigen ligase/tetratricopeptide (TPR) repeat protein
MADAVPAGALTNPEEEFVPVSQDPAATRLQACRILLAICAAVLGIQLFSTAEKRLFLYIPMALNAAVLAGFGIWQKMHWEEWNRMLFGRFPLKHGGQPFASYVNRNAAAGYLCMGIAVAAGWGLLAMAPRIGRALRRVADADPRRDTGNGDATISVFGGLLSVVCIGLAAAGILVSRSRGGTLAFIAAAAIGGWCLFKTNRSRAFLIGIFVAVPIAVGAVAWFGFGAQVRERLKTLSVEQLSKESRIAHWTESWSAVLDAPWLGGGLGAYRYINRPYQRHFSDSWYVNADNQYLEWLVEMGLVGAALVLAFLCLFAMDTRRLLHSKAPWEQRDAALMGAMVLASQATMAVTDFGITMTANLITAATLGGIVVGAAARSLPFSVVSVGQGPLVFRRTVASFIGAILLAGGGLAWWEVKLAAAAFKARDDIPLLNHPEALSQAALEGLIGRAGQASDARPDDAELHRVLAELLIFRYRTQLYGRIAGLPQLKGRTAEEVWQRTAIERQLMSVAELNGELQKDALKRQWQTADPDRFLEQALDQVRQATATCPRLQFASRREATLQVIVQQDLTGGERSLYRDVITVPADPSELMEVAAIARLLRYQDLSMVCLHRSLELDPSQLREALAVAGDWKSDVTRMEQVLPEVPQLRLDAAEQLDGTEVAIRLAADTRSRVEADEAVAEKDGLLGRAYAIERTFDKAALHLRLAAEQNPQNWTWRMRAAEALESAGRLDEAIEQVTLASRLAPDDLGVRQKLAKLKSSRER